MKRIAMLAALCGFVLVVPAQADKPPHPLKPSHANKPDKPKHQPNSHKCLAHSVGYNASGTLKAWGLTKAADDGRYDGTITVTLTRANHKTPIGDQLFPTVTDARVIFHNGVNSTTPAPGSRVGVHGKITELPHSCSTIGFTPTVTVKKVDIRTATKP
jgi:hypothetical protein